MCVCRKEVACGTGCSRVSAANHVLHTRLVHRMFRLTNTVVAIATVTPTALLFGDNHAGRLEGCWYHLDNHAPPLPRAARRLAMAIVSERITSHLAASSLSNCCILPVKIKYETRCCCGRARPLGL